MVVIGVVLGYAALCVCVWQVAAFLWDRGFRGTHRLPSVPATVLAAPCSKVDVGRRYFVTSHGLALYVRKWLPRFDQAPRGVVFLLHGMGEHGGRYEHVAREMAKRGFAVFSVDHQGHGLSDGERQYVGKVQHYAEDFLEFVHHVLDGPQAGAAKNHKIIDAELEPHGAVNWRQLPRFMLGHSMGGIIALLLVELSQQQRLSWNGVVLSSPALWGVPGGGCPLPVRIAARLLPRFTAGCLQFSLLSDNVDVYNRWVRDPLRDPHGCTLRLGASLLSEGWRLTQPEAAVAKSFPAPLYVLHGEMDTLTYPQGSMAFYTACAHPDKTLNIVPKAVHEIFTLEGHEAVLQNVLWWMDARLK